MHPRAASHPSSKGEQQGSQPPETTSPKVLGLRVDGGGSRIRTGCGVGCSCWSFSQCALFPLLSFQLLDLKIFVDTDSDIRLVRRLRRDISERGRDIEGVIKQYNKFVKPAFDQYIQPTMRLADIVVPRGTAPCSSC